jgi:large subunit ribosomal protein L31
MKKGIHPKWVETQVICACGNTFSTRSVKPVMKIEVCSRCHPFFTGQRRIVDTAGRVERFMQRMAARQEEAEAGRPTSKRLRRREERLGTHGLLVAGEETEEAAEDELEQD